MTPEQKERYSRQIGEAGQEALLQSSVAVVGCGALGTFQAAALARAGVGRLRIIDRDYIEPSNLQRQWLFEEEDASQGLPKAVAAERALRRINSGVAVDGEIADLNSTNIDELLEDVDLILDGTDNFETRYLMNEYALRETVPWIYGAAVGSYGLTMPVVPGKTCCLQCIYPAPPSGSQPTCETEGVLGSVTASVAAQQVADGLRLLAGLELKARITTYDVWNGVTRQVDMPKADPDCRACGKRDFGRLRGERRAPISLCGRDAVQIHELTLGSGRVARKAGAVRKSPGQRVRATVLRRPVRADDLCGWAYDRERNY
jgi:molybdopterin-synthase adenylyltransferase